MNRLNSRLDTVEKRISELKTQNHVHIILRRSRKPERESGGMKHGVMANWSARKREKRELLNHYSSIYKGIKKSNPSSMEQNIIFFIMGKYTYH